MTRATAIDLEERSTNGIATDALRRHVGAGNLLSTSAIQSLYQSTQMQDRPAIRQALSRWQGLLAGPCGCLPDEPSEASRRLAEGYGFSHVASPAGLLFSAHTLYALLVRLLVWQWAAVLRGDVIPASRLDDAADDDELKQCMVAFERGRLIGPSIVASLFENDPFAWYLGAWDAPLAQFVRQAADSLAGWRPTGTLQEDHRQTDLLTDLYQAVFPAQVRHALGEYYTPNWLADHLLDEVGYTGNPAASVLDPTCGSGRFLTAAIRRMRRYCAAGHPVRPSELCQSIVANVVGFDLHPLAVLSAKANYLFALGELAHHLHGAQVPVLLRDCILRPDPSERPSDRQFDFVVGNPPWLAWDHLTNGYREATKPLWQRYGLFSLSGSEARHGGGKKDLSTLVLYRTADLDLKHGGRLGMVTTQTVFQSKGAGDGFRRFRIGTDGPPLRVLRVNDLVELRPFADAANWTSTVVLEKGSPTDYPVSYIKWRPSAGQPKGTQDAERYEYYVEPIDPLRPSSPWFLRPPDLKVPLHRLTGPSEYRAHLGANSGGANGVYWVDVVETTVDGVLIRNLEGRGKRRVERVEQSVEPELLYPLVRWGDVSRYRAVPSAHVLLVQDLDSRKGMEPSAMAARYPKTLAYLTQFRELLASRAAYRQYQQRAAFYSMYNVGRYTVAPIKVVWRRMDRQINAAVVEALDDPLLGRRAVVPQETCVLVAVDTCDEAHYLCGLLNSAVVNFLVAAHSVQSGKGFGTPSMLDYLRLARFDAQRSEHAALAAASRQAHSSAASGNDLTAIQGQIDQLASSLWNLDGRASDAIRREISRL